MSNRSIKTLRFVIDADISIGRILNLDRNIGRRLSKPVLADNCRDSKDFISLDISRLMTVVLTSNIIIIPSRKNDLFLMNQISYARPLATIYIIWIYWRCSTDIIPPAIFIIILFSYYGNPIFGALRPYRP